MGEHILITGTVLTANEETRALYRALVDLADSASMESLKVYSPLDTMEFEGTSSEKYNRAMELVKNSSAIIAEMSSPSTGQGMEIGTAISRTKPILAIHKKGTKVSSLVTGCPQIEVVEYEKVEDLRDQIYGFIQKHLVLTEEQIPEAFLRTYIINYINGTMNFSFFERSLSIYDYVRYDGEAAIKLNSYIEKLKAVYDSQPDITPEEALSQCGLEKSKLMVALAQKVKSETITFDMT